MFSKSVNSLNFYKFFQFLVFTSILLKSDVALGKNRSMACKPKGYNQRSNHKPFISAYYQGYNAKSLSPDKIPWKSYNHLKYFVAVPSPKPEEDLIIDTEKNMLEVIAGAKSNNVSILLSVGGWTGSRHFSFLVGNSHNRTLFAKTIVRTLKKYKFDGVDIDWEYPNVQGLGCNALNKNDSKNFLKFLKVLRKKLGKSSIISAAVSVQGFMSSDGENYLKDVKGFGKVIDFFTIMAYDVYTSSSKIAGPNAPLFDTCSDPTQKFSVSRAIKHWTSTGIPANQIVLGLPSYGHSFTLSSSKLSPTKFSGKQESLLFQTATGIVPSSAEDGNGGDGGTDPCGNPNGPSGSWTFKELLKNNILSENGLKGKGDYKRHYDNCAQTPFLFNSKTKNLISYDDPVSLRAKSKFALSHGLAGVEMFDAIGDSDDLSLIKSIRKVFFPSEQ